MQAQEFLSDKNRLMQLGAVALLCAVGYFIYTGRSQTSSATSNAFFTTDDGQTVFVDSSEKLSPFDHYGKPAYRMSVFTTDGGKTRILAYLERYTPEGKIRLEPLIADFKAGKLPVPPAPLPGEVQVKLPGANNSWVSADTPDGAAVRAANIPSTGGSDFEVLLP